MLRQNSKFLFMKNQRKNSSSRSGQGDRNPSGAGQEFRSSEGQQPGGLTQDQRNERKDQKSSSKRGASDFSQESNNRSALRRGSRDLIQPQMNNEREYEPLDAASLYDDNDANENNLSSGLDLEDEDDTLRRS
jgi:hypothetical protein